MEDCINEEYLLKLCSGGDRQAFSLLYKQYLNPLYRYIYLFLKSREVSEEIVQDVFVKLWENRTKLSDVRSFKPFLYHMSKNMVLDHIRRMQTEIKAMNRVVPLSASDSNSEDLVIYKDYLQIAQEAINHLTEKRRMIFLMRTQQELSIDEIAADLHISRSVVKKQLYTSLNLVRAHIEKQTGVSACMLFFLLFY